MIRSKPRNNLVYGVGEIFMKYVFNRTYLLLMLFPIFGMAVMANVLYAKVASSVLSEIADHIEMRDLGENTHIVYKLLIYGIFAALFEYFPIFLAAYIVQDIYTDCYRDVFFEYISLDYNVFHEVSPGDLEGRINRKCKAIGDAIDVVIPTLMSSTIFIVIAMVKIVSFGSENALLFLTIPLLYISTTVFLTSKRNIIRGKYNVAKNKSVKKLSDILNNYEVVKSFGLEERESSVFHSTLNDRVVQGTRYSCSENIITFIQKLCSLAPHAMILYLSLNNMTFMDAITLNGLHAILKERMTEFAREFVELYENYYDYSSSTYEKEEDMPEQVDIEGFGDRIVFDGVGVNRGEKTILEKVSFELKKGEKLAIAGPNGAGKSTLINALLRFLEYSGKILIDGVEMNEYKRKSIRKLIAYVPQDNCVIDGTVLRNLRYGDWSVSLEKVKEICMKYGTHEVFSSLEGGYFKQSGQQGCELSVGQKQYMSLMRAIIKDSPIFILDEATSDVDQKTEAELIDYIMSVLSDRTIIMIVHNHELLKKFDKVLFLSGGTMKGCGSINELLKTSDKFVEFYLGEDDLSDTGIQPQEEC